MKNKFVLRFGFLLVSFFVSHIAFGQELMDKIAEEACQKIEEFEITEDSNKEEVEAELERIFARLFIPYVNEINEEYDIDFLEDTQAASKFGEKAAIEIAKRCPKFIEIAIILAQDDEDEDEIVVTVSKLDGKFLRIEEKGDFLYLTVKDKKNRAHKLLWYEHFDGADQFINNPKKFRGKQVSLTYKKVEVYSPQIKDYRIVKQLVSLEFD